LAVLWTRRVANRQLDLVKVPMQAFVVALEKVLDARVIGALMNKTRRGID
jgi:hypothetical protein